MKFKKGSCLWSSNTNLRSNKPIYIVLDHITTETWDTTTGKLDLTKEAYRLYFIKNGYVLDLPRWVIEEMYVVAC